MLMLLANYLFTIPGSQALLGDSASRQSMASVETKPTILQFQTEYGFEGNKAIGESFRNIFTKIAKIWNYWLSSDYGS